MASLINGGTGGSGSMVVATLDSVREKIAAAFRVLVGVHGAEKIAGAEFTPEELGADVFAVLNRQSVKQLAPTRTRVSFPVTAWDVFNVRSTGKTIRIELAPDGKGGRFPLPADFVPEQDGKQGAK